VINPWFIIAALIAFGAATGGAYLRGRSDGKDSCLADAARDERVTAIASEAAASATAQALSKLEVKNVTITKALQTEVVTREVFRECRSGPDALRLLNSTPGIAAPASAASSGG
jgi:hypothetical protein